MPELTWIGKDKVVTHHNDVSFRMLERTYSFDAENGVQKEDNGSKNMIIHGDNLEALKALQPMYENKVNCIFIDPPYGTGNEGWVYNDNVNDPRIKKWLGEVVGKEGEDLSRHDKWLCMMYPRLKLLQKLLCETGAIFVSIDDNEQSNLKQICDEIFGSKNFVANIVWKKKTNGNNMGIIPAVHDYIMVYAKNIDVLPTFSIPLSKDYIGSKYSNPDNDPRGPWTTTDLSANHKGPYYGIENPITKQVHYPPEGRYWVFNEEETKRRIADGRIIFGKSGTARPVQRVFASEREMKKSPDTWIDSCGYNSDAMLQLADIIGKKKFDYPKPESLIHYLLGFSTSKDSVVLDSFAGSGTTAHAVLSMNKQDGGKRKFILIELGDYADTVTAERIKRVINGYGNGKDAVPGTGGSFSFYELGDRLFDENGGVNPAAPLEEIRKYVWYSETRAPYAEQRDDAGYYLGEHAGTGYYLAYEPGKETVLDYAFLSKIKIKADRYVIYTDRCALSEEELNRFGITYKKTNRDIAKV